ncbi:tetratricopeptide repeat protein [Dethiosulfovibrio salsuginis]|uniref:Tetratricopeptide repeat-containing protein n=1 Tax=Dethiosulfovibrio salsuginis TaxID=561720 RepID=A0A1X7KMA1_9BACT|nr:tetratricopeptide repeat protein [Dethiosulfovibrio salsuginis]SMG42305.1 Tetratricopeptide repeat-containing protein [Dethiosulfovibrio salsuginis]
MDKRLEEWFRKPVESLSPDSMGLPVVVRSQKKSVAEASPLDFLRRGGKTEDPSDPLVIENNSEYPEGENSSGSPPLDIQLEDILLGPLDQEYEPQGETVLQKEIVATPEELPDEVEVETTADFEDIAISQEPEGPVPVFHGEDDLLDVDDSISVQTGDVVDDIGVSSPSSSEPVHHDEADTHQLDSILRKEEDVVLFGEPDGVPEPALNDKVPKSRPTVDSIYKIKGKKAKISAIALALLVAGTGVFFMTNESSETQLRRANEMYLKGEMKEALELYEKSEKNISLDARSLVRKGDILALQGREAEALNSYYGALAIDPESVDIHRKVANTFFSLGSLNQAEKAYNEILRLDPTDSATRLLVSRLKLEKGDIDGALNFLEGLSPGESSDEVESFRLELLAKLPSVEMSPDIGLSSDIAYDVTSIDIALSGDSFDVAQTPVIEVPVEVISAPVVASKPVSRPKVELPPKTVERKPKPVPAKVDDFGRFSRILSSGRNIGVQDGPALKRLTQEDSTGSSLYSLGRMFNRAGRPREAMVFLEKALAKDGNNRWLLAETAYSFASVGRNDEALAMMEHALVRGDKIFPGEESPSILFSAPSQDWDIGWDKGNGVAEAVSLYSSEAVIPGLSRPKLESDRYESLQEAIRINPQDRPLYIGIMALYSEKGSLPSLSHSRALALGMEAHACISKGNVERGRQLLQKAINLAPDLPFLMELREMSEESV